MASRFWAGGSSSEEEESDYSEESDVETSQQQQARAASRWAVQSDSDSEEEKRVVKSAKDKAFENIDFSCRSIRNSMKINDWAAIQTEFDALVKHLDRAKNVISAQGLPKTYLRTMAALEDLMAEKVKNKAEQKKMSKENSKALIRMKGKLKKQLENIQSQLEEARANPKSESESGKASASESSDDSDSDSDADSDSESDASESESDSSASERPKKELDSDNSDEWGSDSDDSDDSDSSDASVSSSDSDSGQLKGRAKWLKKTTTETYTKDRSKKPKPQKERKEKEDREQHPLQKAEEEELNLTTAQFDRRLKDIIAVRGKRGTELKDQMRTLRKLATYARRFGPARQIVATMYLLGAQLFDATGKIDRVMAAKHWRSAQQDVCNVVTLLQENPGFVLTPLTAEDQADLMRAAQQSDERAKGQADKEEDEETFVDTLPTAGTKGTIKVSGDLATFCERLADEYTKSLQQTDPHSSEYVGRLFDEHLLLDVAKKVQKYLEDRNEATRAASLALIRAELIYYKHESVAQALYEAQAKRDKYGDPVFLHPASSGASITAATSMDKYDASSMHPASLSGPLTVDVERVNWEKELKEVCVFVFQHADIRGKTRAMLCRIYHQALHDKFHQARDQLLMSHIQDNISEADISTQILFNRMMAQLGLCAFRLGLVWEAHACLSEICTGSRTKELLAQGMQANRFQERDVEQERQERRRQVPYHLHINLELLEMAHLVCAMLLEVPNMVNSRVSDRKRMVSKTFRKLLEYHERNVFQGPPENPRDHVVAAAKLLAQGSWRKSADLLINLSVWNLLPGEEASQKVRDMIRRKVQVEALRTYLLAFSDEYEAVALDRLTQMFDLEEKTVHSVVSKMMINEELHGAWDQSSQAVLLRKGERSSLQVAALQYSSKLSQLVENNERMLDLRSGTAGKDEWNASRRGGGDHHGFRSNRSFPSHTNRQHGGRGGFRPHGAYQSRRGGHTSGKRAQR